MRKHKIWKKTVACVMACVMSANVALAPVKAHAVAIGGALAVGEVAMDIAVPLMMVYLLNQYGIVVIDGSDRQALVDFGREQIVDFKAWLSQTEADDEYEKPKSKDVDNWLQRGWLGSLEKIGNVYHYFTVWIDSLVSDYQEEKENNEGATEVVNTTEWINTRIGQLNYGQSQTDKEIRVGKNWGRLGWTFDESSFRWEYELATTSERPTPIIFVTPRGFGVVSSEVGSYNYTIHKKKGTANVGTYIYAKYFHGTQIKPLPDNRNIFVSGSFEVKPASNPTFLSFTEGAPVYELDYADQYGNSNFMQAVGELLWYVEHGLPLPHLSEDTPIINAPTNLNYMIDDRTINIYNEHHTTKNIEIYPKTGDKDVTVKIEPSGKYSDLLEAYTNVFGTVPLDMGTGYTIADGEPTVFAPLTFPDYQYNLPLIWKKFPFSILEDIGLLYDRLKAEPEAPHFELAVPLCDEPLVVDMTDWNDLAISWRKLELFMVIVGLICVTMGFIGGGKND